MSEPSKTYSEKWQRRFAFFDQHGGPSSPGYKPALAALPRWRDRVLVNANIWAFFFTPIALFAYGLWKKALVWLLMFVVLSLLCLLAPEAVAGMLQRGVSLAMAGLGAVLCNFAYYQKERHQHQSWNLFEGMRF